MLVQLRGQVVLEQIRARTAPSVSKQRQRLGQIVEEGAWAHQIWATLLQADVSVVLGGTGEDNRRGFHAAAGQLVEEFVRQRCGLQLRRLLNSFSTATSSTTAKEFVHQQYLCLLLLAVLGLHMPFKG